MLTPDREAGAASGDVLGYVPKDLARDFAPLLDVGAKQAFTIKKCLETASGFVIPVVWGALYRADAAVAESKLAAQSTLQQVSGHRISEAPNEAAPAPTLPGGKVSATPSTATSQSARQSPSTGRMLVFVLLLLFGLLWLVALLRWAGVW